ncbi:MAG TPA: twin-arginine translocase subunit TatC [Syntrophobacteraceae bacterium]|nr:twin-arginine translocase subunit TatC [Syntrophobacteraceae bacterium]
MPEERLPFTQHLEELRKRLLICVLALGIGFLLCYAFADKIFQILCRPWLDALPKDQVIKLISTAPHEAFFTYIKVAFIAGFMLAVPIILYELWCFIAPGLYENEKRAMLPVVFFSSFFFLGGASFGYFFVFPYGFQFFTSFATDYITPMITTREFLTFTTRMLIGFGVVFELPIFAFFLARLGLITAPFMRRMRKAAIIVIFIIAAAITPGPDIFSQLMMAGPLVILYEASVWIVHVFGKKEIMEETDEEEQPASNG